MEQRAFVERALGGVLPPARSFPFKVRLNTSVLSANGSAVAVAVSSGSLALHNVNVPASNLVTGNPSCLWCHGLLVHYANGSSTCRGDGRRAAA